MAALPEPFARVVDLDRILSSPVVQFEDIKARRQARRMCQVFLKGQGSVRGGGSPVAMAVAR